MKTKIHLIETLLTWPDIGYPVYCVYCVWFSCSQIYLVFKSYDFDITWWRFFQERVILFFLIIIFQLSSDIMFISSCSLSSSTSVHVKIVVFWWYFETISKLKYWQSCEEQQWKQVMSWFLPRTIYLRIIWIIFILIYIKTLLD